MIKCEVIEQCTYNEMYKLKNIKRKLASVDNTLFVGDTFECDKTTAEYLSGKNPKGKKVIKIKELNEEKLTKSKKTLDK